MKTRIFSFDGTGNEPADAGAYTEDESISNVLKLHVLCGGALTEDQPETKTPQGNRQQTYYYTGIGTRNVWPMPVFERVRRAVNTIAAPKWGDARRILEDAMDDFRNEYAPEDKIVIFGFSRGAALARKFAAQLLEGQEECRVSFLGVFDTVAAMNGIHRRGDRISSDVVFENGTLHARIDRAVHAVSLDEDRVPFTPTLINHDTEEERILEVWFPGVHSDIGGGYWFDGLSDTALAFMIEQCRAALENDIRIHSANTLPQIDTLDGIDIDDIAVNPLVDGVLHEHAGLLAEMGDREPRSVHVAEGDRPSRRIPILHRAVKERFHKVSGYRPPALRGLTFKLWLGADKISSEKNPGRQRIARIPVAGIFRSAGTASRLG